MNQKGGIVTVQADFRGTGLNLREHGSVSAIELGLSNDLAIELQDWVDDYQVVIQLDMFERYEVLDVIEKLDKAGLLLAQKVFDELKGSFKVGYYSEGLLQSVISNEHLKSLVDQVKVRRNG